MKSYHADINANKEDIIMKYEDMLEIVNDNQKQNLDESTQYIKKISAKLSKKEKLLKKANDRIKELKLQLDQCNLIINELRNPKEW